MHPTHLKHGRQIGSRPVRVAYWEGLPVPVPSETYTVNNEEINQAYVLSLVKASTSRDPDSVPGEKYAKLHTITQS